MRLVHLLAGTASRGACGAGSLTCQSRREKEGPQVQRVAGAVKHLTRISGQAGQAGQDGDAKLAGQAPAAGCQPQRRARHAHRAHARASHKEHDVGGRRAGGGDCGGRVAHLRLLPQEVISCNATHVS